MYVNITARGLFQAFFILHKSVTLFRRKKAQSFLSRLFLVMQTLQRSIEKSPLGTQLLILEYILFKSNSYKDLLKKVP